MILFRMILNCFLFVGLIVLILCWLIAFPFIMLIFFIVAATFVKETGIDDNRPDAQTAKSQDKANILIAITEKNEIWIDRRKVDIRAVRPNIERLHAENPQGSVVIQADKKSNTETLISVMDASRQAGVFNVAIAAQQ